MEKILEKILLFILRAFGFQRFVFVQHTGTGAIAVDITYNVPFRLLRFELHINTAPSTSQSLTLTRDAKMGTRWDTVYYKRDLSVGSVVDLVPRFGQGYEFPADTLLKITYANTDGRTWGIETEVELLEG